MTQRDLDLIPDETAFSPPLTREPDFLVTMVKRARFAWPFVAALAVLVGQFVFLIWIGDF